MRYHSCLGKRSASCRRVVFENEVRESLECGRVCAVNELRMKELGVQEFCLKELCVEGLCVCVCDKTKVCMEELRERGSEEEEKRTLAHNRNARTPHKDVRKTERSIGVSEMVDEIH